MSGPILDKFGNLYGTTVADGAYGYGNVFELTPFNENWAYKDLWDSPEEPTVPIH